MMDDIYLGQTVNSSAGTQQVKSIDQTSDFSNVDEKVSKLRQLIKRGTFDKDVAK